MAKETERKAGTPREVGALIPSKPIFDAGMLVADVKDDSRKAGGRGGSRYHLVKEFLDFVDKKLAERQNQPFSLATENVKVAVAYNGKASNENFIYGLMEAIKKQTKSGKDPNFRVGIREDGARVGFFRPKPVK